MTEPTDSIGSFLRALGAQLPGPRNRRAAILAELHDGLLEATESHQRGGHDRVEAVRLALSELGDARTLAASFRPELMLARGRQTAIALLATTAFVGATWIAAARSRDTKAPTGLFDSPGDHVAAALLIGVLIVCGLCTVVTTGRLTHRLAPAPRISLISAAATGLVTILADLAAVTVLGMRLAAFPGAIHALALATAITASCASVLVATRSSSACIAMIKAPHR